MLATVFMWVPAHGGIEGNGRADFEARQATLGIMVYTWNSVSLINQRLAHLSRILKIP
jgi:hypothetical protein